MPTSKKTEIDKKIGKKMLELRLSKGLSRDSMAEAIGVTHQQIAKYESGFNRLSVGRLLEVAKALDADPSYFYSDLVVDEDVIDSPRSRMNLEIFRSLNSIEDEYIQNGFLQLIRKVASHIKTKKEDRK